MADIGRKEHYNRAELLGGYDQIVPGGLYEISFIRRVFSPSGPVTRRIAIFGQVHRAAADRQPNALPTLALLLDANGQRERAFISGSSERPYAGGRVHSQIKTIGAFSWNEWHHYRLLIRAHPTEGHVEVWRNGEQACLFDKVPIDYWSGRGPYFQFGIYARADSYNGKIAQETLVSEYDEISGPTRLS